MLALNMLKSEVIPKAHMFVFFNFYVCVFLISQKRTLHISNKTFIIYNFKFVAFRGYILNFSLNDRAFVERER